MGKAQPPKSLPGQSQLGSLITSIARGHKKAGTRWRVRNRGNVSIPKTRHGGRLIVMVHAIVKSKSARVQSLTSRGHPEAVWQSQKVFYGANPFKKAIEALDWYTTDFAGPGGDP